MVGLGTTYSSWCLAKIYRGTSEIFLLPEIRESNYILGGRTVYGDPDTLELLRNFMNEHNRTEI